MVIAKSTECGKAYELGSKRNYLTFNVNVLVEFVHIDIIRNNKTYQTPENS